MTMLFRADESGVTREMNSNRVIFRVRYATVIGSHPTIVAKKIEAEEFALATNADEITRYHELVDKFTQSTKTDHQTIILDCELAGPEFVIPNTGFLDVSRGIEKLEKKLALVRTCDNLVLHQSWLVSDTDEFGGTFCACCSAPITMPLDFGHEHWCGIPAALNRR